MEHTQASVHARVSAQRAFFRTGATLDVSWRIRTLKKLKQAVLDHREALESALLEDLGKSPMESYLCDIGPVIAEINEILRKLRRWARPETHYSGLMCFPSAVTRVYKMPYGVSLIISPFNFPVLLTLGPLAASLSAGNTAVIKASSKSPASTRAMGDMLREVFPESLVALLDGGHDVADMCLQERFDKIFYTGSPAVAGHVLTQAARHLTPVALELGGETGNFCIVRRDADLQDAARKIAFMKLLNAGQVCININQIAVAREVAEPFLEALKREFTRQIGEHPEENPEYPRLISPAAYERCCSLAERYRDRIIFGGSGNPENQRFAPTLLYPVDMEEDIVRQELFCPLLPVVPFRDGEADLLMETIARREHPLALYVFTSDRRWARKVMTTQQYGGGCINEVCLHLMVPGVPFNGTGHSGMGAYHGEWGFREFSHPSTVLTGRTFWNLSLREHPYSGKAGKKKMRLLKMVEK